MSCRVRRALGAFIGLLALAALFALPGVAAADDLGDLNAVEWAEEFDALWSIEDTKERERRSTQLVARMVAQMARDQGNEAVAGLVLASIEELSSNPGVVNAGAIGVTGSSVAASAISPDAAFSRSLGEVNNILTDLGAFLATYQLFKALYVDQNFKDEDMWGYVRTGMLYYMNRFPMNAASAAWAFNLAFVDYALTKVLEESLTSYEEAWYDAYQWFFLQGPGKMGMQDWADLFEPAWAGGEGEDYVTYLDSFWDDPERFRLPGGAATTTAEIFDYYFTEVEGRRPPFTYRSALANARMKDAFRGRLVRNHLVTGMRMILEERRDLFEGRILNEIRAREQRLNAELRRLTERRDWTVRVVDSSSGDPVAGARVAWYTMWQNERGEFETAADGTGTINAPRMTPKLNFRIWKYRYRDSEDAFYPDKDPGPEITAHLQPHAPHGLTVQVVDRRSDKPIQGAKIDYWFEERTANGETDDEGFAWRDFPDGMYVVMAVEAPGYQPVSDWGVQLHEEPVLERIELEPEAGSAVGDLKVIVLDAGSGDPVAGATVRVDSGNHRDNGVSDPEGGVSLAVVPDALTKVEVAAVGFRSLADSIRVGPEGSVTTVRLERGGRASLPEALELAVEGGGRVEILKPLALRYSYSVPPGKKHDLAIKVLDSAGAEHDVEYRRDLVSAAGAESGVIRFDGPPRVGPYKARMAVIYGGKPFESAVLNFDAEYSGELSVTVKSDSGEEGVLRLMVPGLAELAPAPDSSLGVERVDWFMTMPGGRRVPSRDNGTERTAGANGYVNDIRFSERAALGTYEIEAQVVSVAGTVPARGRFELLPPEDVPPDSEFSSARVSWAGALTTGQSTPLMIDGLPFSTGDLAEGDIHGLGTYKGSDFRLDRGVVFFRPRLSGQQTAMFVLQHDGTDYPIKFSCNVDLTMIESRVSEEGLDESKGTVTLLFRAHRDFEPPFRIRRQTPRGALEMGAYQESMGSLMMKGELNLGELERPPVVDILDSEGAEARIDLASVVSRMEFRDTGIPLGTRAPLELRGTERVGNVRRGGVLVSPNIDVEYTGGTAKLFLETKRTDSRRQYLWAAMVGPRGIGVAGDWVDLKPADEVADATDSDCDPPSAVRTALQRIARLSGANNPMMGAINRRDIGEIQSQSASYFDDSIRVNRWAANLRNCDMLTNEDREFFGDMATALEGMKVLSDPASMQQMDQGTLQEKLSETQRIMGGLQSRSAAVERRIRRSGFYDLMYGN